MDDETRELTVPFELTRSETDGDGLTLEGYAAVFNTPTEIDSREGHFVERVLPGAFKRSLGRRMPVLMFNHGRHPIVGEMPIGKITEAREDQRGLFVQARLHDNWMTKPVRDSIESGAVEGMSFRFSVPKGGDVWRRGKDGLRERDLAHVNCPECGPVVFPAYPETSVAMRSEDTEEIRDELVRALWTLTERATAPPYGDVAYADPGYQDDKKKRYPIDTEAHVRAAMAYISQAKNQTPYSAAQVDRIKARIMAAGKRMGMDMNPDNMNSAEPEGTERDMGGFTFADASPILTDAIEDQLYEDTPGGVCLCDLTDTQAVYMVWEDGESETYQIDYKIASDGSVTLGTPAEVVKKTTYVPAPEDDPADVGPSPSPGMNSADLPPVRPSERDPESFKERRRQGRLLLAQHRGVQPNA